jgi:hypothetical protein
MPAGGRAAEAGPTSSKSQSDYVGGLSDEKSSGVARIKQRLIFLKAMKLPR